MKVYHVYDENGQWMTVTQNKTAVERKLRGLRGQSAQGGGGKVWMYFEEDVVEDYVPKKKTKPATGCKEVEA